MKLTIIVIEIVIFNQGVHSVKLIFNGALDKHTIITHIRQTNLQKQAYMQNTQQDKITIKNLNNNFEKKIKW